MLGIKRLDCDSVCTRGKKHIFELIDALEEEISRRYQAECNYDVWEKRCLEERLRPLKIGDKVYQVFLCSPKIHEYTISGMQDDVIVISSVNGFGTVVYEKCFGIDTFLTKEEAEKKLKMYTGSTHYLDLEDIIDSTE